MHVAFFVHSFPEISETFILRQVTGLLDRGHTVRIFAHSRATPGPVHEAVSANGLRRRVRHLPGAGHGGGWRALVRTLVALAPESRFDIVHCHYGDIGLRYRFAARLWRAPLIVSFYGYDCSAYPRAHGRRCFDPVFAHADAVTALARDMRARLRMLGCPPALLRTVPLAVDVDAFPFVARPAAAPDRPLRILTVARLAEKKGIGYGLRAVARLRARHPDLRLRYEIVGDGPLRPRLAALAHWLGLDDCVRFAGERTQAYVRRALREADVFLLPSVTAADGDREGTPTALLEAASSGLPVVSTRHAGIPEIVAEGESGYLAPERDPAALADALSKLVRSPRRRVEMGRVGRRRVERRHDTRRVAERLETLYETLIDDGSADSAAPVLGARSAPSQYR